MLQLITISFLVVLQLTITGCCDCDKNKSEKRLPTYSPKKTINKLKLAHLKGRHRPVPSSKDFEYDYFEKTTEAKYDTSTAPYEHLQDVCLYFQTNEDLDFEKMIDMWEIVFYRSEIKLSCFRFIIRQVPIKTKMLNQIKYGDFNGSINWNQCHLQIITNTKEPTTHYLQGDNKQSGVLQNIILTEEHNGDTTIITLHDHSPNQWMVMNELLLMRECDNGDLLVFSRVPYQPKRRDINEAFLKFREEPSQGKWACTNDHTTKKNNQFHISIS